MDNGQHMYGDEDEYGAEGEPQNDNNNALVRNIFPCTANLKLCRTYNGYWVSIRISTREFTF